MASRQKTHPFYRLSLQNVSAGDAAESRAAYEEGLKIRRALVTIDPRNAGWRRDVFWSLWKLASMCAHHKSWADVAEALAAMDADGVLAPSDRKFLARARQRRHGKNR